MLKLKDILKEQSEFVKLIIQTPAPQEILNIVRETKPRGVAFILKAVSNLGAEPNLDTIVELLKLDPQFGTGTVWATETNDDGTSAYVYIFGKDQKDAQRKTKFNVLVVPRQYIYDKVLGKESSEEAKVAAVNNSLVSKYSIGDAAVFFEEEIDKLAKDVAPLLDKEQLKAKDAEIERLQKALAAKSEPDADKTTEISSDGTIEKTDGDVATESKAQVLLKKLETEPIKLNTTSDDVAYIQDLMYRIGMLSPKLGDKNDIESWAEFRDAKPQFGTYGTRTKNFIDAIKKGNGITDTGSDITAEVFQTILNSGKTYGITETKKTYYLDKFIQEQFDITADIDKEVMGKTKTSKTTKDQKQKTSTKDQKKSKQVDQSVYVAANNTGKLSPIGTDISKLNYNGQLGQGNRGEEVKRAQVFMNGMLALIGKSSEKLKTDGIYGSATSNAYDILKNAGVLGPKTQQKLYTLKNYLDFFNAAEKLSKTVTNNSVSEQDKEDSRELYKIVLNLYDVFVKNPDKYFSKFSSWYNDREDEAADWIINAYNEAWGPTLKKLAKSKSTYIQHNIRALNAMVNYIANDLIRKGKAGTSTPKIYFADGDNGWKWKSEDIKFKWNYM